MTTDLLWGRPTLYPLDQSPPKEQRRAFFISARIVHEPVFLVPVVRWSHDLGVLPTRLRRTAVQKQMSQDTPRSRNIEFAEELEKPVDDDFALYFASSAKLFRAEQIESTPDQFEIDADGENAAIEYEWLLKFH